MTSPKIKPLLLKPVGKDYLWGGERLKSEYNMQLNMSPLAEGWVCSTHPDGECLVCGGEFDGLSLRKVLQDNPSFMGRYANSDGQLPVLVKLIDAKENLSIQVHPDDDYAKINENGSLGKHEMWYVLDAKADAEIVHGFNRDVSDDTVRSSLSKGSVNNLLRHISVKKDEVYAVNPGTVHGIGAGVVIAEIQENSNITYRLYDYNRVDASGNKRSLQIDKGLDVIDLTVGNTIKQPMRVLKYCPGIALEFLYRCKYFAVDRMLINTDKNITQSSDGQFVILLCTEGNGNVSGIEIEKGNCLFVPAGNDTIELGGKMQLLQICG